MKPVSRISLIALVTILSVLGVGCASSATREVNSPGGPGPVCRVTIQTWKGSAEAEARGNRSEVQGAFASSSAVLTDGVNVVIKGWLGDATVGYVETDQFVVRAWGEEFPSEVYANGQTSLTLNSIAGPDTVPVCSENCTNEQLGLGGVHLAALTLQSNNSRRRSTL